MTEEASVLGMVVQKRLSEEREIFELRPGERNPLWETWGGVPQAERTAHAKALKWEELDL